MTRIDRRYASSRGRSSSPAPFATIPSSSSTASWRISGSIERTALVRNQGSTMPRRASWRPGSPVTVKGSTAHMKSSAMWWGPGGSQSDGSRENAASGFIITRITSS